MQVRVETYPGHGGVEMLRRFCLDSREIEVRDNLDQWHGYDHRYFKVKDADGNLYILRHDEDRQDWDLIMFQSKGSQALAARPLTRSRRDSEEGI
jgi:hypothetical protein